MSKFMKTIKINHFVPLIPLFFTYITPTRQQDFLYVSNTYHILLHTREGNHISHVEDNLSDRECFIYNKAVVMLCLFPPL